MLPVEIKSTARSWCWKINDLQNNTGGARVVALYLYQHDLQTNRESKNLHHKAGSIKTFISVLVLHLNKVFEREEYLYK